MAYPILQAFLDNQFIKTDDPEHIGYLKKSSTAVLRQLQQKKNRPKVITYTLAALDPTISDDEPIVGDVETLIIKNWPAFRNSVVKTKDTPIAYVRAVILEALSKLSHDEEMAAIIWHTGRNIISYYKLAGQKEVLVSFLLDIGNRVEETARSNWGAHESIQSVDIKSTLPTVKSVTVNKDSLEKHLMAASAQASVGGENPQWASNNAAIWPTFFSERAAEGISKGINAALSIQNESIASISSSIQTTLEVNLEQMSSSILKSSLSLNKRSDLLWWKQALYSQRLDSSYRSLAPLSMSTAMAIDLADNVPPIHPKSVDFFLKETLRDVLGEKLEQKVSLAELLGKLQSFSESEKLLLEGFCDAGESRKPFGVSLASLLKGATSSDEFFKYTGIDKNAEISLADFTVWLFHDLEANALAQAK
ncbi:GTPase-associated system all-helical protein GASH [Mariprofundus aestuarium]|nr:GTPase-associated system all-helical protein GASH [Mariprofundus aestuarium]